MPKNAPPPYEICVYCKQPINPGTIFRRLTSGEPAHLICHTDHMDEEKPKAED